MRFIIRFKKELDESYSNLIMSYYFISIMFSVFTRVASSRGYNIRESLYIIGGGLIVFIGKDAIIHLLRRDLVSYIFYSAPIVILYLISFLKGTDINILSTHVIPSLLIFFPLFLCAYKIEDYDVMYKVMKKWSFFITFIASFILFVPSATGFYSMNFSYILLLAILVHINEVIKKKYKYFFLVVYEVILNFVFGSRGSILCILAFLTLIVFFKKRKNFFKFFMITLFLSLYINLDWIGIIILKLLETYNIHSRTIVLLLTNRNYLSGRDKIADMTIEMIKEKPIFGWGIGGEFNVIGNYPHNIILELMIDYGIVFGSVIFVVLIILIIFVILETESDNQAVVFIFVAQGFVTLFVSSSYLLWPGFYILLGVLLRKLKDNKQIKLKSI